MTAGAGGRERVVVALSYFAEPQDLIPDNVPGLGFLDDALLAELVIEELEPDVAGYREFCDCSVRTVSAVSPVAPLGSVRRAIDVPPRHRAGHPPVETR